MELPDLISRFRGPLAGLFASWGVSWHDAHELAQDTFVEAYLGRDLFRGDFGDSGGVGRWLRGIARNLHRNATRRARLRRVEPIEDHEVAAPGPAETSAAVDALRTAIDGLPADLATVIYMHYLEATGVREVAGLLGVKPKTVEGRLFRARQLLRSRLGTSADAPGKLTELGS